MLAVGILGKLADDELVLGIPGMLEELDELEELGILGMLEELEELDDDGLGILGELEELDDELEELGILGMLLDDEELDVLSHPASVMTASPSNRLGSRTGFCTGAVADRLVVLFEFIVGLFNTFIPISNGLIIVCLDGITGFVNAFFNDSLNDSLNVFCNECSNDFGNGIVMFSLSPSGHPQAAENPEFAGQEQDLGQLSSAFIAIRSTVLGKFPWSDQA